MSTERPGKTLLRPGRLPAAVLLVGLLALPGPTILASDNEQAFDRFHGVYGSSEQPGRDFFVTAPESPPGDGGPPPAGDLAIGALWGDVAPWHVSAIGPVRFEQAQPDPYMQEPVRVAFLVDEDGTITGMRFETLFDGRGDLERLGDLPTDF